MDPQHELEELDREWVSKKNLHQAAGRQSLFGLIAWVVMMGGFALVFLGLWLNELGEDVRLERMLSPWPVVSVVLGICVIMVSLVFMVRNGHKLRAYHEAKANYEARRFELLQQIHGSNSK